MAEVAISGTNPYMPWTMAIGQFLVWECQVQGVNVLGT